MPRTLTAKTLEVYSIIYSSIKKGEYIYMLGKNNDLITLKLSKDKLWTDNIVKGVILDNHNNSSDGDTEMEFCADVFFTFKDYLCDDSSLN